MEAPDGERKNENFSVLTKTTSGYSEPEKMTSSNQKENHYGAKPSQKSTSG